VRIKKLYSPWDTDNFGPALIRKYGFEFYNPKDAQDKKEPVVVFGCYARATKRDVMQHPGLVVIVWAGMDSLRLHEMGEFVDWLRTNSHRVFHIAHSHWIRTDLEHFGLKVIDRVVLPFDDSKFKFEERQGTKVYHYGAPKDRSWYYGTDLMKSLQHRWRKPEFPDVVITIHSLYKYDELYEVYKDSFAGVRLTEHDNMALSCIELGLMGRCSIFNGNIPCAIPYSENPYPTYTPLTRRQWVWQDASLLDKVAKMILEMDRRPDRLLSEEMREFVNKSEDWLDTKFYE
jgi:hypothetical protein